MHLNDKIFLSFFKDIPHFENNPHIAVGVSGGPDSLALVYILNKWVNSKKGKISALVFNHRIRLDSARESNQVKKILESLNIETFVINAKKNIKVKKNMSNARDNRFEGLLNFCKRKNILHLFLGHHFDDNLETYLIRKINGSNLEGLGSMNKVSTLNNIQIIRPFININKNTIINFNKKHKLKFINDPSNKNLHFTRVKVRNFLEDDYYKKIVKSDFLDIQKKIPNYRTMIWELFHKSIIDVRSNMVKISLDKMILLDELIIEKHILIILKFFSTDKGKTKTSKIKQFIYNFKKTTFKSFNLRGINIIKKSNFLIFSQK